MPLAGSVPGRTGGERRRLRLRRGGAPRRLRFGRYAQPGRAGGRSTVCPQCGWPGHNRTDGGRRMIRVQLVDDHPVVRAGLAGMLHAEPDIEVVGEAGSADEAVAVARSVLPDVVLMDLRMPGGDGVTATAGVLAAAPAARVVVLTT